MSPTKRRIRDSFLPGLIGIAGPSVLRAIGWSWRIRREGQHPYKDRREGRSGRYIIAFWHNTLLPLTYLHRGEGATVLVSRHGDGELIARVLQGLGYEVARGSSTRGGARALMELLDYTERKTEDVGVTPDGPKGPARRAHEGIVFLAAKSGFPILPLAAACESAWRLNSWDRFLVPRPFSRIAVVTGRPLEIPSDVDRERIGSYLSEYESEMQRAEDAAHELLRTPW